MPSARAGIYQLERWDDIQYVLAVARTGSFHAASNQLALNQSTVSRRIHRLERRLGVKLFDRHSHGMTPTPIGAALVERAHDMEHAAQGIERHLAGDDQRMKGLVRLAAPDGIAMHWLAPALSELKAAHPDLQIELVTSAGPVDLLAREADIAVRHFQPKEMRSVAQRVGTLMFSIFASRAYVEQFGAPQTGDDLLAHQIVDHAGQNWVEGLDAWRDVVARHPGVAVRVHTSGVFLEVVRAGLGVGLFPDYYSKVAPELVRLSPFSCETGIWLLSHEETNRSLRVRTTLEFLRRRFRRDRGDWFA